LDVGCSDGRIAARIADRLGIREPRGADVELQSDAMIEVAVYDGLHLPFTDASFDLLTIIDVLHHASDPEAVVAEALRVAGPDGTVIVKDHVRWGAWSDRVLLSMDTASNYGVHELTRGSYLSMPEWVSLVGDAGGSIGELEWPFRVHGLPWRLVARDGYHLLMAIRQLP
jgi:SAM-dependent methyltransferase